MLALHVLVASALGLTVSPVGRPSLAPRRAGGIAMMAVSVFIDVRAPPVRLSNSRHERMPIRHT